MSITDSDNSRVSGSRFTPLYEEFLRLIIEARKTVGISQNELSRRLKKPQPFVSKYEHGVRRLDVGEFVQISKALGIDPLHVMKKLLLFDASKKRK